MLFNLRGDFLKIIKFSSGKEIFPVFLKAKSITKKNYEHSLTFLYFIKIIVQ